MENRESFKSYVASSHEVKKKKKKKESQGFGYIVLNTKNLVGSNQLNW